MTVQSSRYGLDLDVDAKHVDHVAVVHHLIEVDVAKSKKIDLGTILDQLQLAGCVGALKAEDVDRLAVMSGLEKVY